MRGQLKAFLTAIMFLTRVPCPAWVSHGEGGSGDAVVYYPVVGCLVGSVGAAVYWLVSLGYPPLTAALAGIAATAIVTGAFHEDAFADVCDGFGGWTPERRLEIMRDSRVGAFGVVGLILLVGLKASLLASLPISAAVMALFVGHAVARWSSLAAIALFPRASDAASLASSFARTVTAPRLFAATIFAVGISLLAGPVTALTLLILTLLFCYAAGRFFRGWLGGLSGDCLGAISQVTELLVYAVIARSASLETILHLSHNLK